MCLERVDWSEEGAAETFLQKICAENAGNFDGVVLLGADLVYLESATTYLVTFLDACFSLLEEQQIQVKVLLLMLFLTRVPKGSVLF